MNCREAKVAIALHLGHDDVDPSDWEQTRRHVSTCRDCRGHYKSLKKSMAVLEQADVEKTYDVQKSLWSEIEPRLASQPGLKRDRGTRSWGPFVSFTVACMLFLLVWANPPHDPNSGSESIHRSGRGLGVPFATAIQPGNDRIQQDEKDVPPAKVDTF